MSGDPVPVLLTPALQRYSWGDPAFIPRLLGQTTEPEPIAEAWYGAHPLAPSIAHTDGTERPLDALLKARGGRLLGEQVSARFGTLPYLLKVIAAAKPLSIQVHPDASQAATGFAHEQRLGIAPDARERSYRDTRHKPELLVALVPTHLLCGFRSGSEIAAALAHMPELARLLPATHPAGDGLRELLEAYFAAPIDSVRSALAATLERLERTGPHAEDTPAHWALRAHRALGGGAPDLGLLFVFLLELLQLEPRQGVFLAPGTLHAYLHGAGIEIMANSDNVLRAGLTNKHVDTEKLLGVVRFEAGAPHVVEATHTIADGACYPVPVDEFELCRLDATGEPRSRIARGPQTVLVIADADAAGDEVHARVTTDAGVLEVPCGRACLIPDGTRYRLHATAGAEVYLAGVPRVANDAGTVDALRHNIAITRELFERGSPPAVIGTVSGSAAAARFWQDQLDRALPIFRAREAISLHEDLPVGQAFGVLLAWQRVRPRLRPGEGALLAFVFGEGTRATPLTEAECGQKAAISSFVATGAEAQRRYLSTVELAMRHFAPVESYLRRSGFDGLVIKWGDEVQVPTLDLAGTDPTLADADVVRFVSVREITAEDAAHKDWVGVGEVGNITAFMPRRPLEAMVALADRGLLQRRDGRLFGGVNLGSIALSRALLDLLVEEFADEIADPSARRADRPDLDPQMFTALTIAAIDDAAERAAQWQLATAESEPMQRLLAHWPDLLDRLRGVFERFAQRHGRRVRMVPLDFCHKYW